MKKLLKFKEWLSVSDAARHLTILFGEDVSEPDVLRLALDGHLTLSVNFVNGAFGSCGEIVPIADAKRVRLSMPGSPAVECLEGILLGGDTVLELNDEVRRIDGIWDLMLLGADRLDVEHRFQIMTDGPSVEGVVLEGLLLRQQGRVCRLEDPLSEPEMAKGLSGKESLSRRHFCPAGALPADVLYVIRVSALKELQAIVEQDDKPADKPLETRERNSLLILVGVLAELAEIDIQHASKAARSIAAEAQRMGASVGERTIENHLKSARDIVGRQSKH